MAGSACKGSFERARCPLLSLTAQTGIRKEKDVEPPQDLTFPACTSTFSLSTELRICKVIFFPSLYLSYIWDSRPLSGIKGEFSEVQL